MWKGVKKPINLRMDLGQSDPQLMGRHQQIPNLSLTRLSMISSSEETRRWGMERSVREIAKMVPIIWNYKLAHTGGPHVLSEGAFFSGTRAR
jgi:hypothetical protein